MKFLTVKISYATIGKKYFFIFLIRLKEEDLPWAAPRAISSAFRW